MRQLLCILILVVFIAKSNAQFSDNFCSDYQAVFLTFNKQCFNKVSPAEFNKKEFVFNLMLALDPNRIIFTSADENSLIGMAELMPSDLQNAYCNYRNQVNNIYQNGINGTIEILEKLKTRKIDYQKNDSTVAGNVFGATNYSIEKEQRVLTFIKYKVLRDVIPTEQPDTLNKEISENTLADQTKRTIEQQLSWLNIKHSSTPNYEEELYYSFVNSLIIQYDPHSYYFSNKEFNNFKEQLSTGSGTYGIKLEKILNGDFVVSSLIPGSYAWRSGLLNIGDIIRAIKLENLPPLKLENIDFQDIFEYLNSTPTNKLMATIVTKENETKSVTLYKEVIEHKDNSVQSYILAGDIKTGYISLPAFYTTWESENFSGCSNDIATALFSLKKQNIESLILDLRDNGGGSIREAIELAGIFIDFGTLSVEKSNQDELSSLKDINRGVMYSGPLAILINNNSASASEMVSAVLQDYKRAIIVGSKSFGKASGQFIIPVNPTKKTLKPEDFNKVNSLKVTVSKYYRVTGKSYQSVGIIPDIYLPEIKAFEQFSEADYFKALPKDSINKKIYYNPLLPIPVTELQLKSTARIENSQKFNQLKEINRMLSVFLEKYPSIPLDIKRYCLYVKEISEINKSMQKFYKNPTTQYKIQNLPEETEWINLYQHYFLLNQQISEKTLSDPYIEETFNILKDYINTEK